MLVLASHVNIEIKPLKSCPCELGSIDKDIAFYMEI
jgi:hypothetical protein